MRPAAFIITGVAVLMVACAPTIKNVRYNPEVLAFEGTAYSDSSRTDDEDWFVLYNPDTHKIVRDSTQLAETNLRLGIGHFFQGASNKPRHGSISAQYWAGKRYFEGVRALETGRFGEAQNYLGEALRIDPGLQYDSDLHYLRAVCYQGQGKRDSAAAALNAFVAYSQGLVPSSFYLDSLGSMDTYRSLLGMSTDSLSTSLYAGHIANTYLGPAFAPRYSYGFLHKRRTHSASIGFGLLHTDVAAIGLGFTYKSGLQLYYATSQRAEGKVEYMMIGYPLYTSWDNRLGATLHARGFGQPTEFSDGTTIDYFNYGPVLSLGYLPDPRIMLYAVFEYYAYNKGQPYEEFIEGWQYKVWHENSLFIGCTVFLSEWFGITGRWHTSRGFELGLYFMGWHWHDYFNILF